ncbi:MAG: family 20 glycosylhydrolase [Opitutaceae bacterium]|nr:family 20 glycosylhydrolase [Opitutaceae bacterium]
MIRAFQWDLARQVERLDWLLAQLPRYADWGYQELYLHLEDAVEYPSLPFVARSDAYRHRDLAVLVERADRLGIKVVPIVNLLGHTQYLIKTPELRHLNELCSADGTPLERGQVCPVLPQTLETAEKLFNDVRAFCSAGKIHVGLDESFHLGRHPKSREEISAIGLAAHFARYASHLHEQISRRGLKMGMWADMLVLLPEAIPLLPRGIAAYDWYYYPFQSRPRMELYNFREYDLAPALRARGIDYWGCPMNGAFRFEPLPLFSDRLGNLRSWWKRCHQVGAAGFLVTSWEAYRLAIETTTVVDAAASALWREPSIDDDVGMLAHGFSCLHPRATVREVRGWARSALACDAHAFCGYARWELNDRWDGISTRTRFARTSAELRFYSRIQRQNLPAPFDSSLAFRRYLAQRDILVQDAARGVWRLRRLRRKERHTGFATELQRLHEDAMAFRKALKEGQAAARAMWNRSRNRRSRGQNLEILEADRQRLRSWITWLKRLKKDHRHVEGANPVTGSWQLQFSVHTFAPALQKVVVEEQSVSGDWQPTGARFTIEFRAEAARPHTRVRREMAAPVTRPDATFRIGVRGLGQVIISGVELTNGVATLTPVTESRQTRTTLGKPAPHQGFPDIDWSTNTDAWVFQFEIKP